MIRTTFLACVSLLLVSAALSGCSGGSGAKKTATPIGPTATVAAQPTPTLDLTQPDAIRGINFGDDGNVRAVEVKSSGARVDPNLILFADLTGDAIEEAIVPVTLGGRAGEVGFVVLKLDANSPGNITAVYSESNAAGAAISLRVEGGKLIKSQAVPGPDDPECCPSMLKVTAYAWDGRALVEASTETVPNPSGGLKGTPPPSGTQ